MRTSALVLLAIAGCGRSLPIEDSPPPPAMLVHPTQEMTPLFYAAVNVGSSSSGEVNEIRAKVDVRAYHPIQPGDAISLLPGEQLTINGLPLTQPVGSLTYEVHAIPEAADGKYQFKWVRPAGTIAFEPIAIPRVQVSLTSVIHAGTPFVVTTAPILERFGWVSSATCAQKPTNTAFEGGPAIDYVVELSQQPCRTDIGITSQTDWDVAFIDPITGEVTERGHAEVDATTSAWQSVDVVP